MTEAVTLLTVPAALAAAERIVQRADAALSLRRALDGVPDRDLLSIVILARQLDEIARAAAVLVDDLGSYLDLLEGEHARDADAVARLLIATGHLPLSPATEPAKEPAHGEG